LTAKVQKEVKSEERNIKNVSKIPKNDDVLVQRVHELHFVQNAFLTFQHVGRRLGRIETSGIGQCGGNQGTLSTG
jgi:hypothetical protein